MYLPLALVLSPFGPGEGAVRRMRGKFRDDKAGEALIIP